MDQTFTSMSLVCQIRSSVTPFGTCSALVPGRRAAGRLSWGLDEGDVEEGGTGGAREATLLKIYVYDYLNRVHSRPRTDFAQDRTKQGKITQARRVPSTV
jgi:hypothetical protein